MKNQIESKRNQIANGRVAIWLLAAVFLSIVASTQAAEAAVEAWVQGYGNVTDSDDQAQKVVTDSGGNVIVMGNTDDGLVGQDWLVVKYSEAGVPLWTNRYNGPGNSLDQATAVAVDDSGNVFVTGFSPSTSNAYADNFVTIAYSNAGVPLWTNRFDGPAGHAQAYAVALDDSGNVFVTGYCDNGHDTDFATIKYSNAGVALWTNRFGIGAQAAALAVDSSGNVFVTGESWGGSSYNYATIAYSSAGVPLWTNRYNGPVNGAATAQAIAVDVSGNVFVTGTSANYPGDGDFVTIAYSVGGVPLWTNRYNGPVNGLDQALAIALDNGGNVFVTGSSRGSGSDMDYATIAYSGAGVPLWTNRYNGPGNRIDQANALVVDAIGNVFITGSSPGIGTTNDYVTIAYSGVGTPLWTNRYNGPSNGIDRANAIAVDISGNLLVTGESEKDFTTIKYSGSRTFPVGS